MKIIIIWHTLVGISGSGWCGCVVCLLGVRGCRQALNRVRINRFFWRKMIWTMRTPHLVLVQSLTLIGYSSGFLNSAESKHALHVFNTNRPLHQTFVIRITRTSTNTVAVVYHRLRPSNLSKNIVHSTRVKLETCFSIYTQLQTVQFAILISRCRVQTSCWVHFEIWRHYCFMKNSNLWPKFKYSTLRRCQVSDIFIIYIQLQTYQFLITLCKVQTPYPHLFGHWKHQCVVAMHQQTKFKYSTLHCFQNILTLYFNRFTHVPK